MEKPTLKKRAKGFRRNPFRFRKALKESKSVRMGELQNPYDQTVEWTFFKLRNSLFIIHCSLFISIRHDEQSNNEQRIMNNEIF